MLETPARKALIDQALAEYRKRLEAELPADTATLDEIESAVARIQQEVSRDLQRRLVEERTQTARDNRLPCACGSQARFRDYQQRCVVTRHGEIAFVRPYYRCDRCARGFAPLDQQLGLDGGNTTTQVRLWLAEIAAHTDFVEAATLLSHFTAVAVAAATVERTAVRIGTALRQAQRQRAQEHQAGRLPVPAVKPQRVYFGMDGAMLPVREPWKRDGSAGELDCHFAECKLGVAYEAIPGEKGDVGVRQRAYIATLAGVEEFGPLFGALAHAHGQHLARECVGLGDGAPWIWQALAKQCPGLVEIVDFWHASEHLWEVANAYFGAESAAAKAWVAARQEELKRDQIGAVLRAIAAWKPQATALRKLRHTQFRYFRHNAERMRYGTFLKQGYHIGSGVVEAGCRQVICQRLDQAGMHWRAENAEAILALRGAFLSTHPPDLRPYCAMPA
jgi:uncharacterized protein UPF0236